MTRVRFNRVNAYVAATARASPRVIHARAFANAAATRVQAAHIAVNNHASYEKLQAARIQASIAASHYRSTHAQELANGYMALVARTLLKDYNVRMDTAFYESIHASITMCLLLNNPRKLFLIIADVYSKTRALVKTNNNDNTDDAAVVPLDINDSE